MEWTAVRGPGHRRTPPSVRIMFGRPRSPPSRAFVARPFPFLIHGGHEVPDGATGRTSPFAGRTEEGREAADARLLHRPLPRKRGIGSQELQGGIAADFLAGYSGLTVRRCLGVSSSSAVRRGLRAGDDGGRSSAIQSVVVQPFMGGKTAVYA